jgi:glutamine amidotransferase
MLSFIGVEASISSSPSDIANSERLILPGVGHFQHGMRQLEQLDLVDVLIKEVLVNKKPILGICLGMQLLTKYSEEGDLEGLGFVDAHTKKFNLNNLKFKVPHMGWNTVNIKKESKLNLGLSNESRYYFVHSYYVECIKEEDILCTTHHGIEFVSGFNCGNIFGLQFHPEKSHKFGIELLENFCKI